MKIFISYARSQIQTARQIYATLCYRHDVFMDEASLPPGMEFHEKIRQEVARSDLVVFLASKESLDMERYTRTELDLIREKWPSAHGRVLTIMCDGTPISALDSYLTSTSVVPFRGNLAAAASHAIDALLRAQRKRFGLSGLLFGLVSAIMTIALMNVVNVSSIVVPDLLKIVGYSTLTGIEIESPAYLALPFAISTTLTAHYVGVSSPFRLALVFLDINIAALAAILSMIYLAPHLEVVLPLTDIFFMNNQYGKAALSGGLSGAVGAALSWAAIARTSRHARTLGAFSSTTMAGLAWGMMYLTSVIFIYNIPSLQAWHNYASDPVLMLWQMTVLASLGHAMAPR